MNEENSEKVQTEASPPEETESSKELTVRKWTLWILLICGVLLLWHLASDRITPYTTQARVKAYVVPVVPQVAGLVTAVNVSNNQLVSRDLNGNIFQVMYAGPDHPNDILGHILETLSGLRQRKWSGNEVK